MVKKFSTLALAALLALPVAAQAAATPADLEAQIERLSSELSALRQEMAEMKDSADSSSLETLNEKAEKWDEASRIQMSGDFRTRLDYVSAEAQEAYTALNIGKGVRDALMVGPAFGTVLGAFSMNPNVNTIGQLQAGLGAMYPTPAAFIAAKPGGITTAQATDMAAIFYNPEVGALLGSMSSSTISTLLPYFSNAENLVGFMKQVSPAARVAIFSSMYGLTGTGYSPTPASDFDNDTMWTNRLRINLRAKATEDVEFKARLAMYKSWGMENNPVDYQYNVGNGGGPFMLNSLSFDGNSTRQPTDNALRVDRAFMNWNAIGGSPVWFSIGRRPTTDGPPTQFRMGVDERLATPVAYMDYPFDGASLGYAYKSLFGIEDFPGRVRFCYGRGFESGPQDNDNSLNDVDFAGLSWDVYSKDDRFFSVQSFSAFNMFNVPDNVTFGNPLEYAFWSQASAADKGKYYDPMDPSKNLILDRANLGNIYHTDAVYTSKVENLNYFLTAGWSRTKANGMDEMGTSLLGSWWAEPEDKDGYSVYAGVRYDIPESPFKVGLEYNYGTKNWISFTPGNDDLYAAKLATRGHVVEAYGIWNIPAGEAISRFGKAFMRLGFQHYDYDYTGSGFWLGEPLKVSDLQNDPLAAQFYAPIDKMDQVYVSMEAWF